MARQVFAILQQEHLSITGSQLPKCHSDKIDLFCPAESIEQAGVAICQFHLSVTMDTISLTRLAAAKLEYVPNRNLIEPAANLLDILPGLPFLQDCDIDILENIFGYTCVPQPGINYAPQPLSIVKNGNLWIQLRSPIFDSFVE